MRTSLANPSFIAVAQLHVVGKHDLAGGLGEADIARCRNGVGALVVGDRVGEQNLAVLRDFDVSAGNRQREILVVLDLVGADGDRGVRILLLRRASPRAGRRPELPRPPGQNSQAARRRAAATRPSGGGAGGDRGCGSFPSAVFQMEQHRGAEDQTDPGRGPGGEHNGHLCRDSKREDDVRQDI